MEMEKEKESKSVEEVFKSVLKKEEPIKDKKQASELFKDIFTRPRSTEEKKEAPSEEIEEKIKKQIEKPRVEVSISEILRDAYERGLIDRDKYNQALKKMTEQTSNVKTSSEVIADIEFVEKDGKPEIMLEDGEIDIPTTSEIEVVRKEDEISIIVRRRGEKPKASKEEMTNLEKIVEMPEFRIEPEDKKDKPDKDVEDKFEEIRNLGYEGEEEGGSFIIGEMKDELRLNDLRREFRDELKEEKEEKEKGEVEEEKQSRFAFLNFILKFLKRTTKESGPAKLKRLSLENLERVKTIKNERKAIIGVAYVLKQFLEVRYRIPHELTYLELVNDLRNREMDEELKNDLITFFKKISIMVYADIPPMDTFNIAYNLAERTIKELT